MAASLAPTEQEDIKSKVGMAVVHAGLQPVAEMREGDFFRGFHRLSLEVGRTLARCWHDFDPTRLRVGASWTNTLYVPSGCLRER